MRQAAEHALHAPSLEPIRIKWLAAQIDPACQIGVELGNERRIRTLRILRFRASNFGFLASGCDDGDLDLRVPQENFDQLGSCVARPAQNGNLNHPRSRMDSRKRSSTILFPLYKEARLLTTEREVRIAAAAHVIRATHAVNGSAPK